MEKYGKDFLIGMYISMLRIRQCEERLVDPILEKTILCPVHLCSGQEAVAVGVCEALENSDIIFGGHRSHGHFLAKGGRMDALIAEIYGKNTGCSRGRGGSMHLIAPEVGMLGSAPIVAGTISLALGAALSFKIQKKSKVAISFFGDGATGEGVLYESMNFASLKKLPIIFVCENNLYSTHMPIRMCRPNDMIYKIAHSFDMQSFEVDGNDVLSVFEAAENAVSRCRSGEGPVFLECKTYRLRGHVGPDDQIQGTHTDIRPPAEIKEWQNKDPLIRMKKILMEKEGVLETDLQTIKTKIDKEIDDAFSFAKGSEYPNEKEVVKYVFK